MNVVIISGGTGSVALETGLKKISPHIHITNIINAYDNGKSTGLVREVFQCLGPSDIRKVQFLQYKNSVSENDFDQTKADFMEGRYNFDEETIWPIIQRFNYSGDLNRFDYANAILSFFKACHTLFDSAIPHQYTDLMRKNLKGKFEFRNFNIANVIYGFHLQPDTIGQPNKIIRKFAEYLNITDSVVLNSDQVRSIYGITTQNISIPEEHIVDWNNSADKIQKIVFSGPIPELSHSARKALFKADLIILSAGTQWSSLIPTYMTKGFNEELKASKAKKILVMNNEPDGDMFGVTADDIIHIVSQYLDINDIKVLTNAQAHPSLRNLRHDHVFEYMENNNGKHDPHKLAKKCLKYYFNYDQNFHAYLFDFDDTLYSRKQEDKNVSIENIRLFHQISKHSLKSLAIVSGNSFQSIKNKLLPILGDELINRKFDIWADGGIVKYDGLDINYCIPTYVENYRLVIDILYELFNEDISIEIRPNGKHPVIVSIKPVDDHYRPLLAEYLNLFFEKQGLNNIARITGKTTVDIMNINLDKILMYDSHIPVTAEAMYIGDECDHGNDLLISQRAYQYYQVKDVYETNILLQVMLNGD